MVLSVCKEWGLVHGQEYLVLTREKQPSMWSRKLILDSLRKDVKMTDKQIQSMTKGKIHECWGDDMYL